MLDIDMHDHVFTTAKPHRRICGVYGGIKGDEENQANARLIAAAPDLLAILMEIVATDDAAISELKSIMGQHMESSDLTVKARAAIAKALGESS